MLAQKQVVLDFEGFKHRKNEYIIKEISVCGDFLDTICILPPFSFDKLSSEEKKSHTWVTQNLHGIDWSKGEYNYSFLNSFFLSLQLRYPGAKYWAKGLQKCILLKSYLNQPVFNLEDLGCPPVTEIVSNHKILPCAYHADHLPLYTLQKHCSRRKAFLYYNWLENETRTRSNSTDNVVPEFDALCVNESL